MGGNSYKRKSLSEQEIVEFVEFCEKNPLVSIRNGKKFDEYKRWRADVSRFMDHDSCTRFLFLLATRDRTYKCAACEKELGMDSFTSMNGFSKYCPICTSEGIWRKIHSPEKLAERGRKITDSKIAFYQTERGKEVAESIGRKNSENMKKFAQTPQGKENIVKSAGKLSRLLKHRILNGTFTPKSNNKNTHWESTFKGISYRSSWEALYQSFYPEAQHEKLRIKYSYKGEESVYIVDFIDYTTNTVAEVKPKEMSSDPKFISKRKSLEEWCNKNGFSLVIADQYFLVSHPFPTNLEDFDENTARKIKKLYETTKN